VERDNRHYGAPTGKYLNCVFDAEPLLRNFFVERDPAALLHTERYWRMIHHTTPPLVHPLIRNEVNGKDSVPQDAARAPTRASVAVVAGRGQSR
jgi:hypothetical protein